MTPTVPRTLGQQVYQQIAAKGVNTWDGAVRLLALHAHRTRLSRAQLVHVLAQFAPTLGGWSFNQAAVAAAERLLVDRGETPDAGQLEREVADHWPAAGPWPADDPERVAGAGDEAARQVAEAALAETCGAGRDGEDQAEAEPGAER